MATLTTCAERLRALAILAAVAVALCGCVEHSRAQSRLVRRGQKVFSAACAGCHTLTRHDTRAPGGDLALAALSARQIASFVRVMPVELSSGDVAAVAAYVRSARTGPGH